MHAPSLSHAWHRWHDHAAPTPTATPAQRASTDTTDDAEHARLHAVRWIPIIVPGMALLMLVCASLIGSVLR